MLLLTATDLNTLIKRLSIDTIIDLLISELEKGFKDYDENETLQPVRSGFNSTGLIEWMPVLHKSNEVVLKLVSYFPENPTVHKIPTIQAHITRNEFHTGRLTELIEGGLLTAMRTGAASAVASRVLAKPESSILGIIGCGAQCITQAHAISRVFPIEEILVFDTCKSSIKSIENRLRFLNIKVRAVSLAEVEKNSDILCTATSVNVGEGPVITGMELKKHIHINAIGSDYPGKFEIPKFILTNSLVVPDLKGQALKEGECQQLQQHSIGPELHEIIKNPEKFKNWQERNTVFDSTGIPLEDAIALDVICKLARQENIGKDIEFGLPTVDPKNPYELCLFR
nr:ornithine cyclodeaminase family protein [uncultured Pedobacter sp.]